MKIISKSELNNKMRNFVIELLQYDNLAISFDENSLWIGVVHYDVVEHEIEETKEPIKGFNTTGL